MPVRACVDQVSDRDLQINYATIKAANPLPGTFRASGGKSLIYDGPSRRKGGSRLELARLGGADRVEQFPSSSSKADFARTWRMHPMRKLPVVPTCRMATGLLKTPNQMDHPRIPHPQEGRFAVVTDVGSGMRWTRELR
jgi:hypothetical protein